MPISYLEVVPIIMYGKMIRNSDKLRDKIPVTFNPNKKPLCSKYVYQYHSRELLRSRILIASDLNVENNWSEKGAKKVTLFVDTKSISFLAMFVEEALSKR